MKTRYFEVTGDIATPLPDRLQYRSTHSLDLTDEQYNTLGSPRYFKVVKGLPELKSMSELEKEEKDILRESDRLKNKEKRKSDLSSLVATVNGKNIQVRESDEMYLRRAIEAMEPLETRKWIMADNSVDIVTREELIEALNIGLSLGQSAFDEYIEWLENN